MGRVGHGCSRYDTTHNLGEVGLRLPPDHLIRPVSHSCVAGRESAFRSSENATVWLNRVDFASPIHIDTGGQPFAQE